MVYDQLRLHRELELQRPSVETLRKAMTVALPCTPTLRTTQGCSSDQHARHRTGVNAITTRGENT